MIGPLPAPRRILVFGSHFLRSIVREIVGETPDVEIVGEGEASATALAAAAATPADFVVVSVRDSALAAAHLDLLEQRPRARVLALAAIGEDASLWELCPEHELIRDISPEGLREAIRKPDWKSVYVS
jgi:DNA-binding NarL/FixJ family response regulator